MKTQLIPLLTIIIQITLLPTIVQSLYEDWFNSQGLIDNYFGQITYQIDHNTTIEHVSNKILSAGFSPSSKKIHFLTQNSTTIDLFFLQEDTVFQTSTKTTVGDNLIGTHTRGISCDLGEQFLVTAIADSNGQIQIDVFEYETQTLSWTLNMEKTLFISTIGSVNEAQTIEATSCLYIKEDNSFFIGVQADIISEGYDIYTVKFPVVNPSPSSSSLDIKPIAVSVSGSDAEKFPYYFQLNNGDIMVLYEFFASPNTTIFAQKLDINGNTLYNTSVEIIPPISIHENTKIAIPYNHETSNLFSVIYQLQGNDLLLTTLSLDSDGVKNEICSPNYFMGGVKIYDSNVTQQTYAIHKNSYLSLGNTFYLVVSIDQLNQMVALRVSALACDSDFINLGNTSIPFSQELNSANSHVQSFLLQGPYGTPQNLTILQVEESTDLVKVEFKHLRDSKRIKCQSDETYKIIDQNDLVVAGDIYGDNYKTNKAIALPENFYVEISATTNTQFSDCMVQFSLKLLPPIQTQSVIFELRDASSYNHLSLFTILNNTYEYKLQFSGEKNSTYNFTYIMDGDNLLRDKWYSFLLKLKNGENPTICIKGEANCRTFEDTSFAGPLQIPQVKRSQISIGSDETNPSFNLIGIIDEFTLYNGANLDDEDQLFCLTDQCDSNCHTCQNNQKICTDCVTKRMLVGTTCGYCNSNCKSCEGESHLCTECWINIPDTAPTCSCGVGQYYEGSMCAACGPSCETCVNAPTHCLTCINPANRVPGDPYCSCLEGFYDTGDQCEPCIENCKQCYDSVACDVCKYNRMPLGSPATCQCDTDDIESTLTPYCTSCEIAVVSVTYSPDYTSIYATFPVQIQIDFPDGPNLCSQLFEEIDTRKYGTNPTCKSDRVNLDKVIIELGDSPTIQIGDELIFIKNSETIVSTLGVKGCNLSTPIQYFQQFYMTDLKLDTDTALPPKVTFQLPQNPPSICQEIYIAIDQIYHDGQRGLYNFEWGLKTGPDPNNNIDSFLRIQNLKKQSYITFPQNLFQENTEYTFELYFENIFDVNNRQTFNFTTAGNTAIEVKIPESESFIFKPWKLNEIEAYLYYIKCGEQTQNNPEFQVKWTDITSSPIQLKNETTNSHTTKFTSEKYQFSPGIYTFKIDITLLQNTSYTHSTQFQIIYEKTPLSVFILGGDQMVGYTDRLKLQGAAKDIDLPEEEQQNGIQVQWNCADLIENSVCKYKNGTDIQIPDNQRTLQFESRTFAPYKTYQFSFIGKKLSQQEENTVNIIVTENDLPAIQTRISDQILNSVININDDLKIDIDYDSSNNNENIQYILALIYDSDIVAQKSFSHSSFSYKIWDLFSDLKPSVQQMKFQITVSDPNYIMPQQSSFTLNLNIPPQDGKLFIDKLRATAITDQFNIQVLDFHDEDGTPLSYQYFYYFSQKEYEQEILQGSDLLVPYRNIYSDLTTKNQISMILPRFQLDKDLNIHQGLILVQIIDPRGAIKNITQIIQVDPPNSSIQDQLQEIQTKFNTFSSISQQEQIQLLNVLVLDLVRINKSPCEESNCSNNGVCNQQDDICTCNEGFYFKDCSLQNKNTLDLYNQIKSDLKQKIQQFLKENLSKSIKDQLMKSNNAIIDDLDSSIQLDIEEIQQELQTQTQTIQEQEDIILDLLENNQLNQGDPKVSKKVKQVKQNLGNSLKFLDSVYFSLSNSQENNNNNKRLLQDQQLQSKQSVYDLNTKTGQILQKLILPNGNPTQYYGKSLKTQVSKKTNDGIDSDFFLNNNEQDQQQNYHQFKGFNLQNNDGEQSKEQSQKSGIPKGIQGPFDASKNAYRSNPFQKSQKFPYQNQFTQVQEYSIKQENNQTNVNIQQNVLMTFDSKDEQQSERAACISKKGDEWNSLDCDTELKKVSDGVYQTQCKCKSLSATTVVDDVDNIFKNSKVDKVFSKEGVSAIKNFQFWKSYIFYIYLTKCLILIGCMIKGVKLDKQDLLKKDLREKQKELQQKQEKEVELKQQYKLEIEHSTNNIDLAKSTDPIYLSDKHIQQSLNSSRANSPSPVPKKQKRHLRKSQQKNVSQFAFKSEEQEELPEDQPKKSQQFLQPPQPSNIKKTSIDNLNVLDDQQQQNQNQQKPSKVFPNSIIISEREFPSSNDDSNKELPSPSSQNNDEEEEQKKKKNLKEKLREISEVLFRLHTFVGIFLVFDKDLNRPLRFVLYYLRIHQLLAVSAIFSQNLDDIQTILLSLLTAIFLGIPEAFMEAMLKKDKPIFKAIGFFFYFCIYATTVYAILTSAALMGHEKSNEWTFTYFLSFSLDSFMIETIMNFLKLYLIRSEILQGNSHFLQDLFAKKQVIEFMKRQI